MKVGSLVECVGISQGMLRLAGQGNTIPAVNRFYTVREIVAEDAILLEEIVNKKLAYSNGFLECAFEIKFFREIELLPPLEEEIKECLTRELVEVR